MQGATVEHIVQLFDDAQSLSDAVAEFAREGLAQRDPVLLVMSFEHWQATAVELAARGVDPDEAVASGRLTVRDAPHVMNQFMRQGRPRRHLFEETAGTLVRKLVSRGKRLRVYGEIVDLLAAEGDFEAAAQLEEMWNDLGARHSFTLLCGYSSVHFGNPVSADALRRICRTHTRACASTGDLLGSYLVSAVAPAAS